VNLLFVPQDEERLTPVPVLANPDINLSEFSDPHFSQTIFESLE
jgi:hypothetical protein